ncbi:hypothetical protein CTI12_AA132470 [Artemisia annua]|uniref:Surfeit locus protein 2 (SURF2) n=1 Tax=Artemisia annua TaxID=35608 RepID=A0A2U1PB41_ARTAN|nr:hypothetical protein CTI12_AA132470 [Artemisia annua]
MGKKKNNINNENKQQTQTEQNPQQDQPQIEGKFLLGKPKFKKLENGRYKCVQTGHELPSAARDSYAQTKHCRTGLIDYALARLKPPMNMFDQDPLCRSKVICKLTGDTVNKTEEHIWKHMNGKRFLHMLEKEEAGVGKETSNDMVEENGEQKPEEASSSKEDESKKKKKKKKDKKKKNKKKKEEEKDVSTIVTEIRDPDEKDSDMEEDDFWMPPAGDRWDFDDGKDRWASGSESDEDPENDDANEEEPTVEESKETQELSKRTKRMSIEVEPSDTESSKKKKKKKVEST